MQYLVIGHYAEDPENRWADHFEGCNARAAEAAARKAVSEHPDGAHALVICGTIKDPTGKLRMSS
jgi:hypothetical protein